MKQLYLFILSIVLLVSLSGCDLFKGSGGTHTEIIPPPVVMEWGNLVKVADVYEYTPPSATLDDFLAIGQFGATPSALCIVVWQTATTAYAGCRNLVDDGQWPVGCAADPVTQLVNCTTISSALFFFAESLGPARPLTTAEAELADEIRRQTRCTAHRLDLSPSPCTVM